jgi:hypothetical protein
MQTGYKQTGYIQSGYIQSGYMQTYIFRLKYEALLRILESQFRTLL